MEAFFTHLPEELERQVENMTRGGKEKEEEVKEENIVIQRKTDERIFAHAEVG